MIIVSLRQPKENPRLHFWEMEPKVFNTYDDHQILEIVKNLAKTVGLSPDDVVVCGFDGGSDIDETVSMPRKSTFVATFSEWEEHINSSQGFDPLYYASESEGIPCLGLYDKKQIGTVQDDLSWEHHTDSNVQAALIGVVIFRTI